MLVELSSSLTVHLFAFLLLFFLSSPLPFQSIINGQEEFLETNWFRARTNPWIPRRFIRNREIFAGEKEEERRGSKVLLGREGNFDAILPIDTDNS